MCSVPQNRSVSGSFPSFTVFYEILSSGFFIASKISNQWLYRCFCQCFGTNPFFFLLHISIEEVKRHQHLSLPNLPSILQSMKQPSQKMIKKPYIIDFPRLQPKLLSQPFPLLPVNSMFPLNNAALRSLKSWKKGFWELLQKPIWKKLAVYWALVMVSLVFMAWRTSKPMRWWNSPQVLRWVHSIFKKT